ncbi:MAG TPA: biotin/lipoyl-containing protein [Chloroflexota bacterium]
MEYLKKGLPELLDVLQGSDVRELELREGGIQIRVHRDPTARSIAPTAEVVGIDLPMSNGPVTATVRSSLVGTFYRAGRPGMSPLVTEGSRVEDSTVIGIIEALQVLTDVESGHTGTVTAVLATDGQPVEYGQPLIEVVLDD